MTTNIDEINTKTYLPKTVTAQTDDKYSKFCASRLPCGLCRLTNAMCPFVSLQPSYISCNDNMYTYGHGQIITCSSGADGHAESAN